MCVCEELYYKEDMFTTQTNKCIKVSKLNFLILIFLQPDGVNIQNFKLILLDLIEIIVSNIKVYDIGLQRYKDDKI